MAKLGFASLREAVVMQLIELAIFSPFRRQIIAEINTGPGAHWDPDNSSQLGRDARFRALQYRRTRQKANATVGRNDVDLLPSQLGAVTSRSQAERL